MRINKIVSFSVVMLLIAVVFAGVATVPAAAQAAPLQPTTMQFRYNAQHTGDYSPVAGSIPPNNVLKWNFTSGQYIVSSPAAANGVVYVGSSDNNVYALYANNGTKLWNYTTGWFVYLFPRRR